VGMRFWTLAGVVDGWVGHVGLMVGCVEIYSVPARWEEDLSAEVIGTVDIREAVGFSGCGAETGV